MGKRKPVVEQDGVWRTIGGRRVFIKKGQSLSDAMKESGKFKKISDVKRGEYQEAKIGLEDTKDMMWSDAELKELYKYYNEFDYNGDISDLKGKHVEGGPNSYKEKKEGIMNEKEYENYANKIPNREKYASTSYDDYVNAVKDAGTGSEKRANDELKYMAGEKKYDSVEERYNKDKEFRDMLKREHEKTLNATQKEISAYFDTPLDERLDSFGDKDDLYKQINDNYFNVSRDDFDRLYDKEAEKRYNKAVEKGKKAGLSEDTIFDNSIAGNDVSKYEKYIDDQIGQLNGRYERAIEKGRKAGLSEDTIFDNSIAGNSISKYEKYIDDQIKGKNAKGMELSQKSTKDLKKEYENEAEKYYSKLGQYQAREDLDMRKSWLDDNVYAPDKRKEYEDFYKQGEEYYQNKYGNKAEYNSRAYAKELSQIYNAESEYDDKITPKYIQDIDAGRYGNMSDEQAIKNWIDGGADVIYNDDAEKILKNWNIPVKNDDAYGTYKNELTKQLLPIYKRDKQKVSLNKLPIGDLKEMAQDYKINTKGLSRQELIEKLLAIYNK